MDITKYGVWFFYDGMTAAQSVEFARTVEKHRYGALWIPEAVGREPFAHAAYLAAQTERLVFATGIANIYARDPLTMAAAAKTVGELSGGRFLLGIGVSHKRALPCARAQGAGAGGARRAASQDARAVRGGG